MNGTEPTKLVGNEFLKIEQSVVFDKIELNYRVTLISVVVLALSNWRDYAMSSQKKSISELF